MRACGLIPEIKHSFIHTFCLCVWPVIPDEYGIARAHKEDNVRLPCNMTTATATSVTWLHTDESVSRLTYIYANGRIYKRPRWRFDIYNDNVGDYSLTISHVRPGDAGIYRCYDQLQQRLLQTYTISVRG